MLRSVGPDRAVLDAVILAGLDSLVQDLTAARAVLGMNRCLQILVGKRIVCLASEKRAAGVGGFELKLRQMQLQRAEMAGVERGLQQAFAFSEVREDRAGLVLAPPAPDRRADDAYERGRMEWPLDEGDVAEHLSKPRRIRIALGTAALMRQQHDRKIGP